MKDIGTIVRERREHLGLSQERLAATAKCSTATIQRLERGQVPNLSLFVSITFALGLRISDLVDEDSFSKNAVDANATKARP